MTTTVTYIKESGITSGTYTPTLIDERKASA